MPCRSGISRSVVALMRFRVGVRHAAIHRKVLRDVESRFRQTALGRIANEDGVARTADLDIDYPRARKTLLVGLCVLGLFASVLSAPASGGECGVGGQVIDKGNGWTTTKTPAMAEHYYGQTYMAGPRLMAIDPHNHNAIFVANNSVIARSLEGGCTWEEVWEVPAVPTADFPFARGGYAAITSLEVTQKAGTPRRVYAALWTSSPLRVHVIRSDNDGETWEVVDDVVPWPGSHPRVRIAPSNPDVVYLSFRLHVSGATLYYASRDGGESWEFRSSRPGGVYPAFGSDFRIDPVDPTELWEWDRDGDDTEPIHRSRDGGRTWRDVRALGPPEFPQFVDVFHRRGRRARIVALNGDRIHRSVDGGRSWKRLASPHLHDMNVLGIVHGDRATKIALVACHAPYCFVYRFRPRAYREGRHPWIDIMPKYAVPPPFPATSDVRSTKQHPASLVFNAGNDERTTLETYQGSRW